MNEVDDALELLLGPEGLGNFRFVSDSDRGNALALMLLRAMRTQERVEAEEWKERVDAVRRRHPYHPGHDEAPEVLTVRREAREAAARREAEHVRFDEGTPLHWIEAPTQGAGKTSLARLCTHTSPAPWPRSESARLGAIRNAATKWSTGVVFFDNVHQTVTSPVLASAMTDGGPELTWVMTVQPNITASEDFIGPRGRAVRIRLTGGAPDGRLPRALCGDAAARAALDEACDVLTDAWTAAGRPELEGPFVTRWRRWEAQLGGLLRMHSLSTVRDSRAITEPSVTNDPIVTTLRALYGAGSASTKQLHCNPQFARVVKPLMHDWTVRALSQRLSRLAIAGFLVREPGREARWRVSEPS